jgi:hypothetical protein
MTYFRAGRTIIGPRFFTAVFGMGTGVVTWVWSPASRLDIDGNLVGTELTRARKGTMRPSARLLVPVS